MSILRMVANLKSLKTGLTGAAAMSVWAVLALSGCDRNSGPELPATAAQLNAEWVGNEVCSGCHQNEASAWAGSHHDLAMQLADSSTVLGDFDNAEFQYGETTTGFFRRDDSFWISTDGSDGQLDEFEIVFTFGVEPLQQYLVEFPDGRIQALPIAWDSRPLETGGQRWIHLYPDEVIDADDPLHWTGTYQGWNTMCADCHSTALTKGYDPAADRFDTEFTEIDVGCEACHGPGSLHATDPAVSPPALPAVTRSWVFEPGERIAARVATSESGAEVEVCAQCHSRRSQLTDKYQPGDPLLDAYRPALLDDGLYHADGQILDEVYVYGSFLQSAMATAGVTCSDCHEPHSNALRAEGNAVCAQCHLASVYDQASHHQHGPDSEAAECTACHMRAETYMVVDPRRDHSFRVPRPDLSDEIGSPNACNDCHSDQSSAWAAARVAGWYPDGRQNEGHFGQALYAGRNWAADARLLLTQLIDDEDEPSIARATALSLLASRTSSPDIELIERSLDRDPLMILAAIDAAAVFAPQQQVELLQRFLSDPRLAIRIAAARVLLPASGLLSERRQSDLNDAIEEYLDAQAFNSDRPEGLLNTAGIAADQGRYPDAESIYRDAIARHPTFTGLYINLSDLYRLLNRTADSEQILRDGLRVNPDDSDLSFSLALATVRAGRPEDALTLFETAAAGSPDQPYYQFVLAIAYNDSGDRQRALELLRDTFERFPGHADTLFALATIQRDAGEFEEAFQYAERLINVLPGDSGVRDLLSELEQRL